MVIAMTKIARPVRKAVVVRSPLVMVPPRGARITIEEKTIAIMRALVVPR
ncbi:hypothetical protein ACTXLB_14840 [Brachybacterium tyrofermentans]